MTANERIEAGIRLADDADDNKVLDNLVGFSTNAGIKNIGAKPLNCRSYTQPRRCEWLAWQVSSA